jgi:hypothetical protein
MEILCQALFQLLIFTSRGRPQIATSPDFPTLRKTQLPISLQSSPHPAWLNDPILTRVDFSGCNMPAMDLPGYESESKRALEAQLRATLDVIPAYTWYADPSGALTFVNKRHADYLDQLVSRCIEEGSGKLFRGCRLRVLRLPPHGSGDAGAAARMIKEDELLH